MDEHCSTTELPSCGLVEMLEKELQGSYIVSYNR